MPTLVSKIYFFLLFSILFFYIRNWTCQKMSIFQNPRKESNLIKKNILLQLFTYIDIIVFLYILLRCRNNCIITITFFNKIYI